MEKAKNLRKRSKNQTEFRLFKYSRNVNETDNLCLYKTENRH